MGEKLREEFKALNFKSRSRRFMWIALAVLAAVFVVMTLLRFTGSAPVRGAVVTGLPGCPESPNCVCSGDKNEKHAIGPIQFEGDRGAAWARLIAVIEELGGKRVEVGAENYARFEFRSRVFRFVDDVEILLPPDSERIEIRSASRSGYSDMGVNRRRVEAIRERFEDL